PSQGKERWERPFGRRLARSAAGRDSWGAEPWEAGGAFSDAVMTPILSRPGWPHPWARKFVTLAVRRAPAWLGRALLLDAGRCADGLLSGDNPPTSRAGHARSIAHARHPPLRHWSAARSRAAPAGPAP